VDGARGRLPPTKKYFLFLKMNMRLSTTKENKFYYERKMIDRFHSTNKFII
jgi:hypothetical protein